MELIIRIRVVWQFCNKFESGAKLLFINNNIENCGIIGVVSDIRFSI